MVGQTKQTRTRHLGADQLPRAPRSTRGTPRSTPQGARARSCFDLPTVSLFSVRQNKRLLWIDELQLCWACWLKILGHPPPTLVCSRPNEPPGPTLAREHRAARSCSGVPWFPFRASAANTRHHGVASRKGQGAGTMMAERNRPSTPVVLTMPIPNAPRFSSWLPHPAAPFLPGHFSGLEPQHRGRERDETWNQQLCGPLAFVWSSLWVKAQ